MEDHFPIGEDWNLVTSYGFTSWPTETTESCPSKRPCHECEKYVFMVNDYGSIKKWFDGLTEELYSPGDEQSKLALKSMEVTFFYVVHLIQFIYRFPGRLSIR